MIRQKILMSPDLSAPFHCCQLPVPDEPWAFFAVALELFSVQRQCSKHPNQADPHLRQALSHHRWVPHPRQQCHHCHCPTGHCLLGDSMTLIKPKCQFSETPPLPHLSPCSGFPTQHKLFYNKKIKKHFIILFCIKSQCTNYFFNF